VERISIVLPHYGILLVSLSLLLLKDRKLLASVSHGLTFFHPTQIKEKEYESIL
jgi:hypothetical protein